MVSLTNDLLDLVYQVNDKRGEIRSMDDLTKFRMTWVEKECYKPGLILMEDKLWQRISLAKPAKVLAKLVHWQSEGFEITFMSFYRWHIFTKNFMFPQLNE